MQTTESQILDTFAAGIQSVLGWTDQQVYPVLAPSFIDGMPIDVMQVWFGAIATEGGGDGYQQGGSIQRRGTVGVTYFKQLLLDPYRKAEEMLTLEGQGLLENVETVRQFFAMNMLNGLVLEPVSYIGESVTQWEDPEKGLARRDISHSVVWAIDRPQVVQMPNAGFNSTTTVSGSLTTLGQYTIFNSNGLVNFTVSNSGNASSPLTGFEVDLRNSGGTWYPFISSSQWSNPPESSVKFITPVTPNAVPAGQQSSATIAVGAASAIRFRAASAGTSFVQLSGET